MDPLVFKAINKAHVALDHGKKTLVVVQGVTFARRCENHGLYPLLDLVDDHPDMEDAVIGDRLIGRAAALLCALLKPRAVFGLAVSDAALEILEANGVLATWKETVPFIVEKGELSVPSRADVLVADVTDPQQAYELLRAAYPGEANVEESSTTQ